MSNTTLRLQFALNTQLRAYKFKVPANIAPFENGVPRRYSGPAVLFHFIYLKLQETYEQSLNNEVHKMHDSSQI